MQHLQIYVDYVYLATSATHGPTWGFWNNEPGRILHGKSLSINLINKAAKRQNQEGQKIEDRHREGRHREDRIENKS